MKIAIDRHIPFIEGVFEPFGIDVEYSEAVNPQGADALIIRTRTRCDESFLRDHNPRIIATATIGYDHIDTRHCQGRGIEVATAAGCNARAVAQWVFAAIIAMGIKEPSRHTLGIIGVGNVGSVVDQVARSVGFQTILCDPPRAARGEEGFCELSEILRQADIITIHVPLTEQTESMASTDFFAAMKPEAIFLNSSRGEVVDEQALTTSPVKKIGLDVWCNEPAINLELLSRVNIATPHIAGYSIQGKAMGTAISVRSVARALGIPELAQWYPTQVTPTTPRNNISWDELIAQMPLNYDIMADHTRLIENPKKFEKLRSEYQFRNEFF